LKAAPHPQEADRIHALRAYEILDTDREKDFDDIVQLASQLCGVPISVVNLIDADRQWFKAEVGLGLRETPLDTSLCAHVILGDDFVEIPDTRSDDRMADNPLVLGEPGLRFYAGALLRAENGLPIGTLCVLGHEPNTLTPLQRDTLRVLARQVMVQLDLRLALRQADILRREVDHRVKNSLQSLSSIARIKARHATSPDASDAFLQMDRRIATLSLLHEQLYKTDSGAHVDLGAYLQNLAAHLSDIAPPHVQVLCDAVALPVISKAAALIGTLVNECAANAFKHAFPDGRAGEVRVALRRANPDQAVLEMSDSGIGMPSCPPEAKGLGMKIIIAIAGQLGADIAFDEVAVGSLIRFTFPVAQI
jgi:two-component sensor histidine kinase